ncbi:hypothetical protein HZ994_00940 [Akkermansiaceae bacterium]|nr:hypothetical protein HZ994_00940 [Akkermansiaceae bacterium]
MMRILTALLVSLHPIRAEVLTAAHPSDELAVGKTVVWSPLFQATWDAMNAELGGKPLDVDPPNELMTRLDSFQWQPDKVMPEGAWKVWAGKATKGFLETVNREAAAITGEAQGPFRLLEEVPGGLACFGLLDREVEFQTAFFRSRTVPMRFGTKKTEVSYFGTNGRLSGGYGESVKVLAFRPVDGSHALEVSCKHGDDQVVFYRPPVVQDFSTACKWLRKWKKDYVANEELPGGWADRVLHEGDVVQVPYVSLDVTEDMAGRLQSRRSYGGEGDPWTIRRAEQVTRFELYEKGARVRVETSIEVDPFGGNSAPKPVPRKFIYDRPFFVFLWREGAEWPYFGAWIGDDSALKVFK